METHRTATTKTHMLAAFMKDALARGFTVTHVTADGCEGVGAAAFRKEVGDTVITLVGAMIGTDDYTTESYSVDAMYKIVIDGAYQFETLYSGPDAAAAFYAASRPRVAAAA